MNQLLLASILVTCFAVTSTIGQAIDRSKIPSGVRYSRRRPAKKLPYICDLEVGKGIQEGNALGRAYNKKGEDVCMKQCMRMKRRKPSVIGVTVLRDSSKDGCYCLTTKFSIDRSNKAFKTCILRKQGQPRPVIPSLTKPAPAISSTEQCDARTFSKVGCYKFSSRGRYLVNYRYKIKWSKQLHTQYACDFVQACARAAKEAKVPYFATHYWGECWEISLEQGEKDQKDGCYLADGLYQTNCDGTDYNEECLGSTNYYVYKTHVYEMQI